MAERFVRFIVPFPASLAPDVGCRVLNARLWGIWGKQAVVENKPVAGGNIGTETVARSAPDGYSVLMAPLARVPSKISLPKSAGAKAAAMATKRRRVIMAALPIAWSCAANWRIHGG